MKKIIIRHVKKFFSAVGVFIPLHAFLALLFERPQFDAYSNVSCIVGLGLLAAWLTIVNCVEWKKTGEDTFLKEKKQEEDSRIKRELFKMLERLLACIGVCITANLGLSLIGTNITFTALECIKLVVEVIVLIGVYKVIVKMFAK